MSSEKFQFDEDAPVMEAEDVAIEYRTRDHGNLRAVDEISFSISENETFGLVGESGCGKSTVAQAVLGLLPNNGEIVDGSVRFRGVDLTKLSKQEIDTIRWNNISMISQGAMNALNPVHQISDQIVEAIRAHEETSKRKARERVDELFELVGIDPERKDDYPHQFSGGMNQRAYIAMALALEPDLVIADEPTTALDVIVQDQILKRINELQDRLGISVMLITHDISVIAETCDRLGVMYGGKLMEYGDLNSIFEAPHNPYTLGLQNAFPTLSGEKQELISIPGSPPDLAQIPEGCRFQERCPFATEQCSDSHPPLENVNGDHYSACYHHASIESMREQAKDRQIWQKTEAARAKTDGGNQQEDDH